MDTAKVDTLLQYILAVAAENDFGERELGPIHLIKYLYLADLDYARRHHGETYTGIEWQFYHFGPWSLELYSHIEPALSAMGANKRTIHSDRFPDYDRWSLSDSVLIRQLEDHIEVQVALAIKYAVHKYGRDTEALLHDVYKTKPMLYAAPKEHLDFTKAVTEPFSNNGEPEKNEKELSIRQQKKRKAELNSIKEGFQAKLAEKKKRRERKRSVQPSPRYDDVFFEGVETLEKLAGEEIPLGKITCSFSDEFWKSKARYDPEIP
ncbi:MAG: hypothetical protein U5L00_01265 [Desulfovermiculus sp.]|nr:hypothetical protein [Desulfovermiculus sp.]